LDITIEIEKREKEEADSKSAGIWLLLLNKHIEKQVDIDCFTKSTVMISEVPVIVRDLDRTKVEYLGRYKVVKMIG